VSTLRFTVTVGAADVVGVLHLPDRRPAPCVIACHGMGASIPPAHGRALYERAREPRRLHTIAGADHRLSAMEHSRDGVEASLGWLLAHLPDRAAGRRR
jgi:hypothetical protein